MAFVVPSLCDTWRLDPLLTAYSAVAFTSGLRTECERLGIEPPNWATIADHIPWAINDARYPDVPMNELVAYLRDEVPALFGSVI